MKLRVPKRKYLYWTPRILCIIFILFLSIFALDVFIPGKDIGYYAVALFMHLIPNFILTAILIVAWKNELIGGFIFIFLGVVVALMSQTNVFLPTFLAVSAPLFIVGILFLTSHFTKRGST